MVGIALSNVMHGMPTEEKIDKARSAIDWPAPGSEDTKFGVTMGLEVGHAEAEVYAGVQA